jgi:hypothetical protein
MKDLVAITTASNVIINVAANCSQRDCLKKGAMDVIATTQHSAGLIFVLKCPCCGDVATVQLQEDCRGIKKVEDTGIPGPHGPK